MHTLLLGFAEWITWVGLALTVLNVLFLVLSYRMSSRKYVEQLEKDIARAEAMIAKANKSKQFQRAPSTDEIRLQALEKMAGLANGE